MEFKIEFEFQLRFPRVHLHSHVCVAAIHCYPRMCTDQMKVKGNLSGVLIAAVTLVRTHTP